jgi:hypothetical protein
MRGFGEIVIDVDDLALDLVAHLGFAVLDDVLGDFMESGTGALGLFE